MIRVLIAEDSPVVQRVLTSLLSEERGIEIVGVVSTGAEAVNMCRKLRPDLVTMDIFMPEMNGLEATKKIMKEVPTRIVIISSMVNSRDLQTSFKAMHSGAIEVVEKPHGVLSGNYSKVKETLVRVIRDLMAARPQNRFSWLSKDKWTGGKIPEVMPRPTTIPPPPPLTGEYVPELICIGGSTGAPAVLYDVLSSLKSDFPIPIVVAQHIASGFVKGMVDWLATALKLDAKVAENGDRIRPGRILVAPDNAHLTIKGSGEAALIEAKRKEIHIPSIDIFFESAAEAYGARALGIILSGMGRDGAAGLRALRKTGAVTVAQNEPSSVIYGMPGEAVKAGAVVEEMDPPGMISLLAQIGVRAVSGRV